MKDLLHIASLLDDSGHFCLSDKLFKFAQQVQGNFGQLTITEQNRKLEELNYALRQNTQKIKDLMASYKNGSIGFDEFKQMGQNLNQQALGVLILLQKIVFAYSLKLDILFIKKNVGLTETVLPLNYF